VVEAVTHFLRSGGELDRETQKMLREFGEFVCQHWHEPDNGIWEPRDKREHFTHSRLLCWVALDRLIKMEDRIRGIPLEKFKQNRELIRRDIEERAWNPKLKSYTAVLGGETFDATALLLALHEFHEASSVRMQQTYQQLQQHLGVGPGLIYRYEKSIEGGEGAFAICCFWLAEFLARGGGSLEEADRSFSQTLSYTNDLGLFAEEIDPKSKDALGNFPQAFTHVGLINAALSMAERTEQDDARGQLTLERDGPERGLEEFASEVHR
jgi:GH15 family glucan-1,4-alpha-glucosidase